MKYIGNYSEWINPEWIDQVMSKDGQGRPRDWTPVYGVEEEAFERADKIGYDMKSVLWWVYEDKDLDIIISPPWCVGKIDWWITKLMPGQYMPMHTDPFTHYENCVRYWIPLQDYHDGHVFVYKDQMISNYKAGDVYQYDLSTDVHGAANIGHIPRLVLQVTEYR